ncbi:amino acid adenylation domain-containing protein [Leptolyngbya sp. AN02str]|uniref:non-ribosomal peptide synthetase family protein n=1 Tax=Leptolyngbya sp. AN02str TaxID=3423363 RepID=UPI003D322B9D
MNSKPTANKIADIYELSPIQQGLLFHALYAPNSEAYFDQNSVTLQGPLDVEAFKQAWQQAIASHPILRTSFHWEKLKKPVQVVHHQVPLPWQEEDWRDRTEAEQQHQLDSLLTCDRQQGFDFTQPPLLRLRLIRLADEKYQFIFSKHHILLDGWSRMLVLKEIFALYQASIQKTSPVLPAPPPYRNYIHWLRQQDSAQAEQFWRTALRGMNAPTRLHVDRAPTGPHQTPRSDTQRIYVPESTTTALKTLARQQHVTLNTLVIAAWSLLLSRYSGESDITFGVTSSGRPTDLRQAEEMVGPFINTLPLRLQVSPDAWLGPWLQQLQRHQLEMRNYEYAPLVQIQSWSDMPKGVPLFEYVAIFENYPIDSTLQQSELPLHIQAGQSVSQTHYPLSLVAAAGATLTLELGYHCDRFHVSTIQQLLQHLQTLLEQIAANPQQQLGHLSLLTDAERQTLLITPNQTQQEYPRHACIHHLFEAQVQQHADAVAVTFQDQQLTYQQLDQRANQLAHSLQQLGVRPGVRVGICLERSLDLLIALLGVLKAGGAYVPIDPTYPLQRLTFIAENAQISVLLTQSSLLSLLSLPVVTVCLDRDQEAIATHSKTKPSCLVQPLHLAYVIYTSGSTGQPKGVQIAHQAVVNFLCSMQQRPGITQHDTMLAITSLSFDIAVLELVLPLTVGARVMLVCQAVSADGVQLANLLNTSNVTIMQATPATWRLLLAAKWTGKANLTALCGGEALSPDLAQALRSRCAALWNLYGPTEATIWSTCQNVTEGDRISIGQPIANTQLYLLDAQQQPVPMGVPGELYIAGDGIARDYLHQPRLTAEKFGPDPFSQVPGRRFYCTGDLACYHPDGSLEFLGRIDHQTKIRGFRVELSEIEITLNQHPQVQQAVVVAQKDASGENSLVAYLVFKSEPLNAQELRTFLKSRLPAFMIPSIFVRLSAFPLTPNGKLDRRALPKPTPVDASQAAHRTAPQTPTEQQLAHLWKGLLNLEQVSIEDNFFDLGGHSVLTIQLLNQINETFHIDLPLRRLFETSVLTHQATLIDRVQQFGSAVFLSENPVDLQAEIGLDPAIQPASAENCVSNPTAIFLTGATGFLGAFLLAELLKQTQASVYCLVRAASQEQGMHKLTQKLSSFSLWQDEFCSRIIPVVGDLAKPLLGLTEEQFSTLSQQIDVIYHSGAWVNFVYSYANLKSINVLGTQEVLRLACLHQPKPVHFISTFSVFSEGDRQGKDRVLESDDPQQGHQLKSGYAQSKWVAEKLVSIAGSRGLPVCIYRPGRITGDSQTGQCNLDDFMSHLIKGCIQLGSVPEPENNSWIDMTPIDYVSRAIVYLSTQNSVFGRAFHLVNPHPISANQLLHWMVNQSGYSLKVKHYEAWRTHLVQVAQSQGNALYPYLPRFMSNPSVSLSTTPFPDVDNGNREDSPATTRFDCQETIQVLAKTSIICPPVDDHLLQTYFSYFVQSGFLDAPSCVHPKGVKS